MKSWIAGLLQAVGLALYAFLVSQLMHQPTLFGGANPAVSFFAFLLLLIVSAIICALTSFAYPVKLVMAGHWRKAIWTLAWTSVFLIISMVVFLMIVITSAI